MGPPGAPAETPAGVAPRPSRREWLRRHPELIVLPVLALTFGLNDLPGAYGPAYLEKFVEYLTDPAQGGIFPFTWTAAWASFLAVAAAAERWSTLGRARGLLVAGSVPFAATGLFEIVYQFVGAQVQPSAFRLAPFDWFSLVLWTAVGAVGLLYARLAWDFGLAAGAFAAGFVAWGLDGYPQITWGTIEQVPVAYAFNIALKGLAFLLILLPIVRGLRGRRSDDRPGAAPPPEPRSDPARTEAPGPAVGGSPGSPGKRMVPCPRPPDGRTKADGGRVGR